MKWNKNKLPVVSAFAITLVSLVDIQADENPFIINDIPNALHTETKLAYGRCGGNMEGKCGGSMQGSSKTSMEGMCGGNMPKGISPNMLPNPDSVGAMTLMQVCSQCHGLPAPGLHVANEWPIVVNRMKMHMKWSDKWMDIDIPSENELTTVLDYLQKNAQVSINKEDYTDLGSASGKLFSQTCSQCHVLPDPKQHTTMEWQNVVTRMLGHMTVNNKQQPDEQQTKMIIGYLNDNAKSN